MCLEGLIPESDLEFDDAAMATIPPAFDPIVEDALGISRYDSIRLGIDQRQLALAETSLALQTTTTVIAAVTVGLTFASLIWWWTQHYMLYKRNHIHHRHAAREEAQKSRNASRSRSMANGTGTDMREPSITFQRPTYQRDPRDLQMELETIIDEVRARPGRLPVNFTMQELVEALEFQQEMAQPA